ncbi:recombinase family protein [Catellatospora paridis]|uniref:recombinase family protein n=1 Tax=Catellatospora paridis TaxID=1617086 RepID=UPI001E4F4693|nr:recombinase family protein [Catellatospora paridis]
MADSVQHGGPDLLGWWIRQAHGAARAPRMNRRSSPSAGELRFVFYGRISTTGFQDWISSARWQRDFAADLIEGRGTIVAEFFDVGCSRRLEWSERPQAALLLEAIADPQRPFDAIVVGEFERAFYGDQFLRLAPLFDCYGVQVWLPELDGPVDVDNELHLSLLMLLGVHSRREVLRSRFRAKAAMQAQVALQGRHVGGRPPYGYQLVDAGPHPNARHARWGRRAHRLEPDPVTAPHVQWIFVQRLSGRSVAGIARELNELGVRCPSGVDPVRNPHRGGAAWTLRTVAAILANPRYTGRQAWNRQRTDYAPLSGADDVLGRSEARRWNAIQQWVISEDVAHPPLVSEQDFVAAQQINAVPKGANSPQTRYSLTGLIRCHLCGRVLDGHWVHGRAAYRCRHGRRSSSQADSGLPRNVYVHERKAVTEVAAQLGLPDDPNTVSAYLRAYQFVIMCGLGGVVTVEGANPPVAPTAASVPHQRRPAKTPTEAGSRGG